jgi:hypothetical protein
LFAGKQLPVQHALSRDLLGHCARPISSDQWWKRSRRKASSTCSNANASDGESTKPASPPGCVRLTAIAGNRLLARGRHVVFLQPTAQTRQERDAVGVPPSGGPV